jgi:fibronectin type 3 domain-containing protein
MNARRIWVGTILAILLAGLAGLVGRAVSHSATKSKNHNVTLTWNAAPPSKGFKVAGYNIYRASASGGPYTKIASHVSGLTYVDRAVESGKTYFYVVTAVNQSGQESKFSQEIKAAIP